MTLIGRRMSAALGLLLASQLAVTSTSGEALPLTLEQAITRALEANEVPRIAQTRVDRAEAARRQALALVLPTLSAAATYRRRPGDAAISGRVVQREDSLSARATIETMLIEPRAFPLIGSADASIRAEELLAEDTRRKLAFQVAETYYAVLVAEGTRAAAQRRVELAATVAESERARQAAGLTNRTRATRAELELATARVTLTRAENAARTSRLALGYLIVADATAPLISTVVVPDAPGRSAAELAEEAAADRPDIKALEQRAEALRALAREPLMRMIPSLGVAANLRATNEAGLAQRDVDWDFAATLDWTLYDGGASYAEARARDADARATELELDAARRRAGLEVRTALADLSTARAALVQAQEQLRVARANNDDVRSLFARGLASAVEQADAAVAEFEAAVTYEAERFALALAHLGLRQALGLSPL